PAIVVQRLRKPEKIVRDRFQRGSPVLASACPIRARRASEDELCRVSCTNATPCIDFRVPLFPNSRRNTLGSMDRPLAYLLTCACYGTWLHGDRRGSVDRHHIVFGTEFLEPDWEVSAVERLSLASPPVIHRDEERRLVDGTIVDHCRIRHWRL